MPVWLRVRRTGMREEEEVHRRTVVTSCWGGVQTSLDIVLRRSSNFPSFVLQMLQWDAEEVGS